MKHTRLLFFDKAGSVSRNLWKEAVGIGPLTAVLVPAMVMLAVMVVTAGAAPFGAKYSLEPDRQWHITADEIHYDRESSYYSAEGNVRISRPGKAVTADRVRYELNTMKAVADGHVRMTVGRDYLLGDRLEIDLNTETGILYNGTIFAEENHFYIRSDTLEKIGPDTYTAVRATVTTCDGERPSWKITGKDLRLTLDGYGTVKHAALWARQFPVLYSPYLVFPVKLTRQSGLLPPEVGTSDRKGVEISQPLYWAISDSSDATFYEHYMSRRGNKLGVEYRYVLDARSQGAVLADVLKDRKVDDGSGDSSRDWGYDSDDVLRPNSDRYWFRMKHDQVLPFGWVAKLDADVVSDQDYLQEFKEGYGGFDDTEAYFQSRFGRELDDYDDPVRTNRIAVSRLWPGFTLNAEARWYDDVIQRRWGDDLGLPDTTLQKLPAVEFDALKQRVFGSSFYYDLDSEYTYFFREDGTRGHRADMVPRLYRPVQIGRYAVIEPSVGLRETLWYVDRYASEDAGKDRTQTRETADVKLDVSSGVSRVYEVDRWGADRMRHSILPRIVYEYIPEPKQDEYPEFDAVDRIDEIHRITYSLTSYITMRSAAGEQTGTSQAGEGDTSGTSYRYAQLCRFKLEQYYDIREARKDTPQDWRNGKTREPFSPVSGELELTPLNYVSFRADAEWSPYDNELLSHNTGLVLRDRRGDRLTAAYRYTREENESVYMDGRLYLTEAVSLYGDYERNMRDDALIRQRLGCLYQAQCWSVDVSYTDEDADRRFRFMIRLYGF